MGLTTYDLPYYSELDCTAIAHAISEGEVTPAGMRSNAIAALEQISEWRAVGGIYSDGEINSRRGLLTGVPLLHKDGGAQVAGLPREYGSPLGQGQTCSKTGHFFQTLLEHGCEIVGRSRVPELHMSVLGDNEALGSTLNPWDPASSMGGSTAGMTALALGAIPVVHGGDSGGSLRVPASWAGCYTLKPTARTVSASPGGTELFGLNEIFVATRSLRDLRLFIGILSKPARDDLFLGRSTLPHWSSSRRRIGICESFYPNCPVHPDILATVHRFGAGAERLGFDVSIADIQLDFEQACHALYVAGSLDLQVMVSSLTSGGLRAVKRTCQAYIARWYEESFSISGADIMQAVDAMGQIGRSISRLMANYDFVVTPVTALPPPLLDSVHALGAISGSRDLNRRFEEIVHFCAALNMSGHPALVIPYADPELGQPCGVQIIGRPGDDLGLLEFAELLDRGFVKPPNHVWAGLS